MNLQKGFLLAYIKYHDSDAILHCYTAENGFQSFFVRGVFSGKSRKKAYLLPLNELTFTINPKTKNQSIKNISSLELLSNRDFYQDIKANSVVFFVADFLNQILKNENSSNEIYHEISCFLDELVQDNYQAHLFLLFKLLKIQGSLPLNNDEEFLNPETGNFEEESTHPLFTKEISSIWKNLINYKNPYEIKIHANERKNFLNSLLVYYHYHFSDFRNPTSLEIVQQIFD